MHRIKNPGGTRSSYFVTYNLNYCILSVIMYNKTRLNLDPIKKVLLLVQLTKIRSESGFFCYMRLGSIFATIR